MFSEALRKLDENTVNYMIDELKKERDEAVTALAERMLLWPKRTLLWPKEMLQYLKWMPLYLKRMPRLPYYKLS